MDTHKEVDAMTVATSLSAQNVARWILLFSEEHGDALTNLRLQKLLYYAQAWHLALHNKPLFSEEVEAWIYGPVVPIVYRKYKRYRNMPITCDEELPALPNRAVSFLREILEVFGGYSSYQLERMTHNEKPWKKARGDLPPDAASRAVIQHEDMKHYYRSLQQTS
jgi:uncharacterized phage-associated protein